MSKERYKNFNRVKGVPMKEALSPEQQVRMRKFLWTFMGFVDMARMEGFRATYSEITAFIDEYSKIYYGRKKDVPGCTNHKVTSEMIEEMKRLQGQGQSQGEIATRVGVSTTTIRTYLKGKKERE